MAFDILPTEQGHRVTYIPDCPGIYKVNATYGGINVPGMYDSLLDCYSISTYVRG